MPHDLPGHEPVWATAVVRTVPEHTPEHLAVGDTITICCLCLRSNETPHPRPGDHLTGWAPGNLQHHLAFDHGVSASYDGPLDALHHEAHGIDH